MKNQIIKIVLVIGLMMLGASLLPPSYIIWVVFVGIGIIIIIIMKFMNSKFQSSNTASQLSIENKKMILQQNKDVKKVLKKRYLLCPRCKQYTQLISKSVNPLWMLIFFWSVLFRADTTSKGKIICEHCDNIENLQRVFLDTEIDYNNKPLAIYTPNGQRLPLSRSK